MFCNCHFRLIIIKTHLWNGFQSVSGLMMCIFEISNKYKAKTVSCNMHELHGKHKRLYYYYFNRISVYKFNVKIMFGLLGLELKTLNIQSYSTEVLNLRARISRYSNYE